MNPETLIICGGVYHLAGAAWDGTWPWLWNWRVTLKPLDDLQRILPNLLSKLMITFYLGVGYLSLFHTTELVSTSLGRAVLIVIAVFWMVRTAMQIFYFGFMGKANALKIDRDQYRMPFPKMSNQTFANILLLLMLFGMTCYLVPTVMVLS